MGGTTSSMDMLLNSYSSGEPTRSLDTILWRRCLMGTCATAGYPVVVVAVPSNGPAAAVPWNLQSGQNFPHQYHLLVPAFQVLVVVVAVLQLLQQPQLPLLPQHQLPLLFSRQQLH